MTEQYPKMTPADRLYRIVEEGLCIGCGICQMTAGKDRIEVCKTPENNLRPIATDALTHEDVDLIYKVCPGTVLEGLSEERLSPDTKMDDVWGPWRRAVRFHAADPAIRFEGATGGVLTALGMFLLETKRVDFIFHVKTSTTEPTFGEVHFSETAQDVFDAAGSRYGPTAMMTQFGAALDRGKPFAFIGKPCDMSAAQNYAKRDARVGQLVKYWLAPVCGGYLPNEGMVDFLTKRDIDPADVTALRYRGRGCPGPTSVTTDKGVQEYSYLDVWGTGENGWPLPWRCKICADGIGEQADIAVSDTWIGGSPTPEISKTDPGTNAGLIRTRAGEELLTAAIKAGAVEVQWDIVPDEISVYQTHQMQKKYYVWPRHQALADEGYIVPQTHGLRIEELASALPAATNEGQRDGTRQRLRAGRSREPRPRRA